MKTFFALFGIETSHFRDRRYAVSLLVLGVIAVFVSLNHAKHLSNTGDFAVFWWAGKNFMTGNDLYSKIGGADRYIYPPFAAMFFQLYALNSLQVAAFFWGFLNLGFYAMAIVLLRNIYLHFFDDRRAINWAIGLSALFSFRYFWYHQLYVQMNEVLFLLCLAGILQQLRGRETAAIWCFVAGIFIKVLPVFFLLWLISKGNFRTLLKIGAVSSVFVLLPCLFRGLEQGYLDHLRYYQTFLEPFQNGRVEPQFCNYSLSSMLYNWTQPTVNEPMGFSYQWLDWNLAQTKLVSKILTLSLLFTLFAVLFIARFLRKTTHFAEISYLFLCMNLLSAICWEYHIVPLIFVLVPLFIFVQQKKRHYLHRFLLMLLLGAALFLNLVGNDIMGVKAVHYIGGYGFLTVFLFILSVYMAFLFFTKTAFKV